MENKFGKNLKTYRDVLIRSSELGDDCIVADDVFMTDSTIGNRCTIERRGMIFNSTIGDYSYTGYNTIVKYAKIGKFCSVSWNVSIGGADHDFKRLTSHPFPFNKKYGISEIGGGYSSFDSPLEIGNDVWIGSTVCITRGVKIGDGAVIGAGAVVTHDVGPYEIWAGVPAKKIGQRFSDEIIAELLDLKWWDLPKEVLSSHIDVFKDDDLTLEKIRQLKSEVR